MDCIDILLTTYNGEKYLKEQIESILSQSYSNLRLIISDDCSTDNTRQLLNDYKNNDSRIELHFQDRNLGYIKNFEYLLNQVKSEYYMLSDQDDVWDKDKVKVSLEAIKKEKSILVFSDLEVVNEKLQTLEPSFLKTISADRKIKKYTDYRMVYINNCVTGCTILSESKYINKYLPFPTEIWIAHDYWMALILSQYGKLYCIEKPLVKYRQHTNNQIGAFGLKSEILTYQKKRQDYIKYRIEQYKVYCDNNEKFKYNLQQKNIIALKYFEIIYNKKHFNFKGYFIFHFIFKNESLFYYLKSFAYLNFPFIIKLFKKSI